MTSQHNQAAVDLTAPRSSFSASNQSSRSPITTSELTPFLRAKIGERFAQ